MQSETTRQRTILVVDDQPTNLDVVSRLLEGAGYAVLVKRDGESAVALAAKRRPDLILLDIMMPGMDGFETCRALKDRPETTPIPVLFMSALTEVEDKVRGFRAGAVDFITKPFMEEEVLARVALHLELVEARRRLADQNILLEVDNERIRSELLQEQVDRQLRAREFGFLFIFSVLITSLSGHITYSGTSTPLTVLLSSWGYVLATVTPLVGLALWMKQPASNYGLCFDRLRRNLVEGLVCSVVLLPLLVAVEALREPGEPLFTWYYFQGWPASLTILYFVLYPLHSFFQEFIMRGVMQGALSRFLADAHPAIPILMVSLLFGIAHVHKSFGMAVLTFALSAFLGTFYHRHRSLLGVTIIHIALGTMAQALGYL